jgi:hypothetical protein
MCGSQQCLKAVAPARAEDHCKMDGYLAQLCRLASFGSSLLRGRFDASVFDRVWVDGGADASDAPRFYDWRNTFRTISTGRSFKFFRNNAFDDPAAWLRDCTSRGCLRFELGFNADLRSHVPPDMYKNMKAR